MPLPNEVMDNSFQNLDSIIPNSNKALLRFSEFIEENDSHTPFIKDPLKKN